MSFNTNNNNLDPISRNNYEEYFLLYADNELSEQDRLAVEVFVLAHPDLQGELDLFLSTKLPLENINLENKETLLADNMKLNAIDESLLLYLDNELGETQKKLVKEKLIADENFKLQYESLLKTKLESEKIAYPYKKELYHHEEKRRFVFSAYWMRIAAAVIILLGMGIFFFTYQPKPAEDMANNPVKTDEQNPSVTKPSKEDGTTRPEKQSVEPIIKVDNTDDVPNLTRNIEKKTLKKDNKRDEGKPSLQIEPNNIAKAVENKPEQKNQ